MHDEYRAFFRLFGNVARYGCDFAPTYGDPDEFLRPLSISHNDFLTNIYEPRDVEAKILESLSNNPNLLCLVGAQGSGKSTIAYKIRHDLATSSTDTFAVFLDLRLEIANHALDISSAEAFAQSLRRRLINEYRERLFPLTRAGPNPRITLWTYLLDRSDEHEKPLDLFSEFGPLQDSAARSLRRHDKLHENEEPITLRDWLAESYASEDDASLLTQAVDTIVDFSHLVYATRFALGKRQQIIWLDNVDALPDDIQAEAVHAAKGIYLPVDDYVGMIVAVREENIFREYDICDEGAPPYETRILLEMPRSGDDHAYFPSQDVPVASEKILKGIVKRRLEATRRYQESRVEELRRELEKLPLSDERAAKLRKEVEALSPVVTPRRFGQIESAADHLFQAMWQERAIYITNNSLRDFLFMFRDCLADMFREPEDSNGVAPGSHYPEWYITTLVLRRARHTARRYQIGVYDVIAATEAYYRGDAGVVGCLLPYLIMTTTWNLTLKGDKEENRYGNTPTVADVERALELIGYSSEDIRDAMHALYYRNNSRQNLIEFRCRSVLRRAADIKSYHVLYVTFRGKCLVARTGSSFGYLYDCVSFLNSDPGIDYASTLPHIQNTDEAVERMIPHFCDMAEMNYRALKAIRDAGALGGANWLSRYYALYGTPQVRPYSRTRVDGNKGRTLLLEGILLGLLGYVRVGPARDRLTRLLNAYMGAVNNLAVEKSPVDPPFRQMMGLASRKVSKNHGRT